MQAQNYFVYILTNHPRHTVLYIGITNDLERRTSEHSLGTGSQFAHRNNASKLIYFEAYPDPRSAIERENQLKNWSRAKKEALIGKTNPEWRDLQAELFGTFAETESLVIPRGPSTPLRSQSSLCSARDDGEKKASPAQSSV